MATRESLDCQAVHAAGLTDVVYLQDGSKLLTCGDDGTVAVFDGAVTAGAPLAAPSIKSDKAGFTSMALVGAAGKLAIGSYEGCDVQVYNLSDGKLDTVATTLPCAVHSIAINDTGNALAVASAHMDVRLVNLESNSYTVLKGHTRAVKSVAFDPKGEYLASSSGDATVRIWKLTDTSLVHTIRAGIAEDVDSIVDTHALFRIQWSRDGTKLAVPAATDIKLLNRNSWTDSAIFKGRTASGHTADVTVVAWSPNGAFLASAALDNKVMIWAVQSPSAPILTVQHNVHILGLAWNPTSNTLAVVDADGRLARISPAVAPEHGSPTEPVQLPTESSGPEVAEDSDDEGPRVRRSGKHAKPKAPKHTDSEAVAATKIAKSMFVTEATEDSDAEEASTVDGDVPMDGAHRRTADDASLASDSDDDGHRVHSYGARHTAPRVQAPFQPGATEPVDVGGTGIMRQYMAFCLTGAIIVTTDRGTRQLEMVFSDTTTHRGVRFSDMYNCVIAALGHEGAVMASVSGTEDTDGGEVKVPSIISYRPFFPGLGSRSALWTAKLPLGEDAQLVATGDHWSAVATTRQLLRLFSGSGMEIAVLGCPGPMITMAGRGPLLGLVFASTVLADAVVYGFQILHVSTGIAVKASGTLTLPKGTELRWIGFSTTNMLMVMDSNGLVMGLVHISAATSQWVPMLDVETAVGRDAAKRHWPVGVAGQAMRFVLCKGLATEPDAASSTLPILASLDLKVPLTVAAGESADLHHSHMLLSILHAQRQWSTTNALAFDDTGLGENTLLDDSASSKEEANLDKATIKLMMLAAKADKVARALDLAHTLYLTKSVDIAARLASRSNYSALAEKLFELHHTRLEEDALLESADTELAMVPPPAKMARTMQMSTPTTTAIRPEVDAKPHTEEPRDSASSSFSPVPLLKASSVLHASSLGNNSTPAAPVNPFAAQEASASVKPSSLSFLDSLQSSPAKPKATLNRNSSFAIAARDKRKNELS